jgi:hypothetical protein
VAKRIVETKSVRLGVRNTRYRTKCMRIMPSVQRCSRRDRDHSLRCSRTSDVASRAWSLGRRRTRSAAGRNFQRVEDEPRTPKAEHAKGEVGEGERKYFGAGWNRGCTALPKSGSHKRIITRLVENIDAVILCSTTLRILSFTYYSMSVFA